MSGEKAKRQRKDEDAVEAPERAANECCDIAIVTHESMEPTFFSCVCDDVTEHTRNFPDDWKIQLHTYVCVPGAAWCDSNNTYHDGLQLARRRTFKKTLVEKRANWRTSTVKLC
jgi:hypothetical protein